MRPRILYHFFFLALVNGIGLVAAQDQPVNFSREILPILSDRCFHCHGPDEAVREADLRLDLREAATSDQEGIQAIVAGDAARSPLFERISSDDEDLLMPPPDSGRKQLSPQEVELFKRWINQGAKWGKHWSFDKPVRAELPLKNRQPIDSFILSKLQQSGLQLSERATKRILIRRLTLDLIGLPPTPAEVDAFLADDSPQAYEKVVDRLLDSPQYGERMAWPWLDAARYADSSGYQGDPERSMWPWRDWVVRSLNDNMPFDQFTIEQLAGDLLPNASSEQRLATGFNRNHMHNSEGGRIAEETRIENVFDRAETTGTVWLGMTLQCARCHDHKFDPTSREDYFKFFDFFNQTTENGRTDRSVAVPPAMDYVLPKPGKRLAEIDQEIATIRGQLYRDDSEVDQAETEWQQTWSRLLSKQWTPLKTSSATSGQGATMTVRKDGLIHVTGKRPEKDVYVLELETKSQRITAIRLDALIDPQSPAKGTGRDEKGNFVLSEIELYTVGQTKEPVRVEFASAQADFFQGEYTAQSAIDGQAGNSNGWAVSGHTIKKPRWAEFRLKKPLESQAGFKLQVRLRFESQHTHHTLALFRLSETGLSLADLSKSDRPPAEITKILAKPMAQWKPADQQKVRRFYRSRFVPKYQAIDQKLSSLESQREKVVAQTKPVKVMVMDTIAKPRTTFILDKGLYNSPTEMKVTAGVPGMLPELKPGEGKQRLNRLDLAKWIVSKENPLTARVTVNRHWQIFFGRGLVETPNDFGLQGKQPSHPELLDWLAVEFMDSGWNVKHLHKLIVMSDTYQQSSRVTRKHLELDPDNRLLGRSPRYRLPSWMIRDQALAASGLLKSDVGGAPVRPYQPAGVWAEATFGKKKYNVDSGDKLYRRSIYTFWRRIIGPTMFFDASKRQTCEVKPSRTNTPLHALTVLNDTTYVEAARILAQNAIQKEKTLHQQLQFIYARLCARPASDEELELLTNSFGRILGEFLAKPAQAKELLSVGQRATDTSLDPAQHAALTTIVNMLMNLDEVLVRP